MCVGILPTLCALERLIEKPEVERPAVVRDDRLGVGDVREERREDRGGILTLRLDGRPQVRLPDPLGENVGKPDVTVEGRGRRRPCGCAEAERADLEDRPLAIGVALRIAQDGLEVDRDQALKPSERTR